MSRPSPGLLRPLSAALIVLALLLIITGVSAALLSRLPTDNEIPGWTILSGGDRVAADQKELYGLYDGAAPDMIQAGIALASQRIYKLGSKRLTVDVYKFGQPAQAKAYYQKRKTEITNSKAFWSVGGATFGTARAVTGRTMVCYHWQKQICCTLSVNGTSVAEKSALEAFTASIAKKITAQL